MSPIAEALRGHQLAIDAYEAALRAKLPSGVRGWFMSELVKRRTLARQCAASLIGGRV